MATSQLHLHQRGADRPEQHRGLVAAGRDAAVEQSVRQPLPGRKTLVAGQHGEHVDQQYSQGVGQPRGRQHSRRRRFLRTEA